MKYGIRMRGMAPVVSSPWWFVRGLDRSTAAWTDFVSGARLFDSATDALNHWIWVNAGLQYTQIPVVDIVQVLVELQESRQAQGVA